MRGRAVWTLLSGGAVLLSSALANAQCTKDTDCKGDRVCDAGKCTSPLPPAAPVTPGAETPASAAPAPDGAAPAPDATGTPAAPADGNARAPAAAPAPAAPRLAPGSVDLQLQPSPSNGAPAAATVVLSDEPQTKRRSRTAMIGGIVMVSVGPIAMLAALAANNAQERCDSNLDRDYPDHRLPTSERYRADECNDYSVPLYVFGIGGAVLTAAGIPLIIYGAKSVPNGPPQASLHVLPWAGPRSSGLRLRLDL